VAKATFTVGVFGLACRASNGTLRIKVNVRTDQKRQRQLAGLPEDSAILIIDMPGGGVQLQDFPNPSQASLFEVLKREVYEETGGCTIESLGEFSQPFMVINNNQDENEPAGDLAFWMPILLRGTLLITSEALDHPWITLEELLSETRYRAPGKLGKNGRTSHMLQAAFGFYKSYKANTSFFS
jgi:8-oxo-dGTP pyrophosphatase MutT (NUDIX family)